MHHRSGMEGTISQLVRGHGVRRTRFPGLAKVRLASLFIGAAATCRRWWRRRVWKTQREQAVAVNVIGTVMQNQEGGQEPS